MIGFVVRNNEGPKNLYLNVLCSKMKTLLNRAQSIIELYIGKVEANVDNGNDIQLLAKATAYQAVYMQDNESIVYEQIAVTSQGTTDSRVDFDQKMLSPWISPLAIIACKALSFKRARGITKRNHP